MPETYRPPVSPVEIENRLIQFMDANAAAYEWMEKTELSMPQLEISYELAKARSFIKCDDRTEDDGKSWTVPRKEAQVVVETAEKKLALRTAEAHLKAAKARCKRIENDLEALRSLSASIRNSMQMGG